MPKEKVKVMIVDDSAVVRQVLGEVLLSDPDIQVIATAPDPIIAAEKLRTEVPDVITLDVEMPRMDGITFLRKLMSQHPIPVVMCSSLTEEGALTTLRALEYGAVDIIQKPRMGAAHFIEDARVRICDAVKAAARARVQRIPGGTKAQLPSRLQPPPKKLTADVIMPAPTPGAQAMARTTERVVLIGASTGGTEALRDVLVSLPSDAPGTVIVQHMPEKFTAAFAERLNGLCAVEVKEAERNDSVVRGRVLIAPGNKHTLLQRSGARYYVDVKDGPLVSRHRPSVDVLFRSGARYAGANAVAAILTGMGSDGAQGMLELKQAGAHTIAQDEATCVVFGMPKEAIAKGGVDEVLPLQNIVDHMLRACRT